MKKLAYEILEEISGASTKEERKRILAENSSAWFLQFLAFAFDPRYEFYAKEFPKNYIEPNNVAPGISYSDIASEMRRVYLFTKGNDTADNLPEAKRDQLLVQTLEMFEPREARAFYNMLKKDLKTKGLTLNLVKETFPTLIPQDVQES